MEALAASFVSSSPCSFSSSTCSLRHAKPAAPTPSSSSCLSPSVPRSRHSSSIPRRRRLQTSRLVFPSAQVAADAASTSSSASDASQIWLPLLPIETLPKGERRLVKANGDSILLLWYKNDILAIENSSPAEGAYSEGLYNAKLTQDGAIICPLTDSTFDLQTGQIRDWFPNNPILRFLTPPVRNLRVYPVKVEDYQICVNVEGGGSGAELVISQTKTKTKGAGETATDVVPDEIRMVVDDTETGFGFNSKSELLNGRAAMAGFFSLILIELVTGKGILGATGFLDFIYRTSGGGGL